MPAIISVANLTKTYASGFHALESINLEIRRGEIFALLGPNGAGKTTLINIICGIVNPSGGTVTVDGHDIIRDYRAARSLIGLVPQELTTDAFETVWATVSFSRGLFGKPANPAHIEKVLKSLSLWDKKDSKIMTLSGGMKRRVLIAKALCARAADPVPRRADRRRRRGAAQGHVGGGARAARLRRHHHPHHPLHRRGRGDGRPHRRHQQGRDHPGRGEGRADAQARQEAAHPAPAEAARRHSRGARGASPGARRRRQPSSSTPTTRRASAPASRRCSATSARPASASTTCETTQSSLEDIFVSLVRQGIMNLNLHAVRAIYTLRDGAHRRAR